MRKNNYLGGRAITWRNNRISGFFTLLMIISQFFTFIPNYDYNPYVIAELPPPNDSIDGIQFIEGNWSINDTQRYSDEVIILSGNLTVLDGGNLTFDNVTLMMNCTNFDGEFNIEVQTGGTMNILSGSVITDSPFDTDNGSSLDYEYRFWVREGSNFTMLVSELHECGWDFANYGLIIYSNMVVMKNNMISNNYNGVTFFSSSNSIFNNNRVFNNSAWGLRQWDCNKFNISDNRFYNNNEIGIGIQSSNDNLITKNDIYNNTLDGIAIAINSDNNNFYHNNIYNNSENGITIANSDGNIILNNTFFNNKFGIYIIQGSLNSTFNNCSISNSTSWNLRLASNSHTTLINSTFNESSVYYLDTESSLTIKWFLNIYVNISDGTPLPFASIFINDTYGNPVQGSPFLTNENGYIRLVPVTEYTEQDTNGDNAGDRTYHNPYNISVLKGGYSGYARPEPIIDTNKQVNITLTVPPQGQLHHIDIVPVGPEDYYVNDNLIYQAIGWNDAGETEENITWVPRWSVDNPSIASIDPSTGYFIATDVGTSFLSVTSKSPTGIYQTSLFNILPWPLHHIQITPQGPNIYNVDDFRIYSAIGWNDAEETQVNTTWIPVWSINDTSIGSFNPSTGEFIALGFGNGLINVSDTDFPTIFKTSLFLIVTRPLHHIDIIPVEPLSLYIGDEITLTAVGWNNENESYQNTTWIPHWNVTNSSIASMDSITGEFRALGLGFGEINVSAFDVSGMYKIIPFTIEPWPLHHIVITPSGPGTYYIGDSQTYITIGWNDENETQMNTSWTPDWSVDDPSIATMDSTSGELLTMALGSTNVRVSASSLPQISITSSFTVQPWPLHHVELIPGISGNYYIGDTNNYTVIGWNDAQETQMNTSWTPVWNIENTSLASINVTGFFTAIALGNSVVNVSSSNHPLIYINITFIIHPWPLHHIEIIPGYPQTFTIGDIYGYTVTGWNDAQRTQINTTWTPVWSIEGDLEEFSWEDETARFEVKKSGEGILTCQDKATGINDSVDVFVKEEPQGADPVWVWILTVIVLVVVIFMMLLIVKKIKKDKEGT